MRYLLIATNLILAAVVCHCVYQWISESGSPETTLAAVVHTRPDADRKTQPAALTSTEPPQAVEIPAAAKVAALIERSMFTKQTAQIDPFLSARANSGIRVDLSLVGTYSIGEARGAIIIQRVPKNSRQILNDLQQQEYQAARQTARGITDSSAPAEVTASNLIRQCLRIGDTTVNGYTVADISKTGAVLTRGTETLNLPLLSASEFEIRQEQLHQQDKAEKKMMKDMQKMQAQQNQQNQQPGKKQKKQKQQMM